MLTSEVDKIDPLAKTKFFSSGLYDLYSSESNEIILHEEEFVIKLSKWKVGPPPDRSCRAAKITSIINEGVKLVMNFDKKKVLNDLGSERHGSQKNMWIKILKWIQNKVKRKNVIDIIYTIIEIELK